MRTEFTHDAKVWQPKMELDSEFNPFVNPLDRTVELENPPHLEDVIKELESKDDGLKAESNQAIREDINRGLVESAGLVSVERDKRHVLIAEAAYFISERHGFLPGAEIDDWLAGETEVDHAFTFASADNDR
jgi:hypothetical protein